MTLTVGTDSYCTLAEAEAYMGLLTFKDAWASAGDPAKEAALKQSAVLLDTLTWKGIRTDQSQAMAWPREGVVDLDGYELAPDAIPARLKHAQAELALRLLSEDRTADAGALVPESLSLGSLTVSGLRQQIIPAFVRSLVREYLASSGMIQAVRG